MSDNKTQPGLGHKHDLEPSAVVSFHMTLRKEDGKEVQHLVSGLGELALGVESDQITLALRTKRSSSLDPNIYMEGAKLDINIAEHMIRALITLVQQAKKNAIDMPSPFGVQYTGLPLMPKEGE